MKNWMKLVAMAAMVSLMATGCANNSGAAETTAAVETEAGETATAENGTDESTSESAAASADATFFSDGLDEKGNLTEYAPLDFLEVPDYSAIKLNKDDIEISEEELNSSIDSILAEYSEEVQVKDREVADGDTINLDYVGTIDGTAFDGGDTNGQGTELVIGSGSYIDTFEQQLIGSKPGDQVTVKVTFPEDYGNDDLNGKEAEFACTINYIVEKKNPELTDAFVAENLKESYNVETVDALKEKLAENYRKNKSTSVIWDWLLENTNFTAEPEELSKAQLDVLVATENLYASMYGMSLEDYLTAMGTDEETYRTNYSETAMKSAKQLMIAQAIVDAEKLEADEKVLEEYFDGGEYSQYDEFYGTGYVRMQVKMNMVVEKLMETAVIE